MLGLVAVELEAADPGVAFTGVIPELVADFDEVGL